MKKWIPCNISRRLEINALYTAFDITFDNEFSFAGESHNFYEAICVIDGTVGVAAGQDVYVVSRGNLVIHRPMEFHRIWSEEQSSPRIIIISFDVSSPLGFTGTVFRISHEEVQAYTEVYRRIAECCEINTRRVIRVIPERVCELEMAINNLENLFLKVFALNPSRNPVESNRSECAIKYRDIMKFLNDSVNVQICIDDVARACGMSASGAKQIFHRYTGQGIMRYFRDLKAKAAITMLTEGFSVKETAYRLGFADQNYFSTFFKKITGKSPREYISG